MLFKSHTHTHTEAILNISAHKLLWYYQPQCVLFVVWIVFIMFICTTNLNQILQNFWLTVVLWYFQNIWLMKWVFWLMDNFITWSVSQRYIICNVFWSGNICNWPPVTRNWYGTKYLLIWVRMMEEVCGSQGRLCWKINLIWSHESILAKLWTFLPNLIECSRSTIRQRWKWSCLVIAHEVKKPSYKENIWKSLIRFL